MRARAANGGRLGRYRQYREAYNAINTPEAAALFAGLDMARERKELIEAVASEIKAVGNAAGALGEATVFDVVAEMVQAAGETMRDWWAGSPATKLNLAELDARVKSASGDVASAVKERTDALAALRESADSETQQVEQELRSTTRLDDAQDLLRDQRELTRERFEQVEVDREQYLALVEDLDRSFAARTDLLAQLTAAQGRSQRGTTGGPCASERAAE